ncbi:MAG: pilus assembly protein [Pseudomonadota bacterium]|nr:pilus assembly protein [Pseudomonadota bacterium]
MIYRFLKRVRIFLYGQSGIALIEFALWAPLLMMIFMGGVELTRYIIVVQKAEKAAFIISDSVAQGTTAKTSDLDNIMTAATQVMKPFSFGSNGFVIISSVTQTGTYSASNPPMVSWQYTSSGSNGSWTHASRIGVSGQMAALPGSLTLNDKDNIIIAEIFYNFQPLISTNGVVSPATVYSVELYKPRLGTLTSLSALPFWLLTQGAWL